MPQPDCNLLNGTKAIGTLDMSEKCGLQLGELENEAEPRHEIILRKCGTPWSHQPRPAIPKKSRGSQDPSRG